MRGAEYVSRNGFTTSVVHLAEAQPERIRPIVGATSMAIALLCVKCYSRSLLDDEDVLVRIEDGSRYGGIAVNG